MATQFVSNYVDLQVNGYAGIDFNCPDTSLPQLCQAAAKMQADGVGQALPTVITADVDAMCRCIANLVTAIREDEVAAQVYVGIHIEGPFLSPKPGFIGAHPVQHALAQDVSTLERLCATGGEWTKVVTLAPEVDPQGEMTKYCRQRGIRVAAGHSDASLQELETGIDSGLELFTHLGNGCPKSMDRHDNIIYRALRFRERLRYTLIADGFHVPELLFRHFIDWIGLERIMVVSDAICAAGLGPGTYQLGGREVAVGPDKAARDPSGEHFVGSACTLRDAEVWLAEQLQLEWATREQLLVRNATQWLANPPG